MHVPVTSRALAEFKAIQARMQKKAAATATTEAEHSGAEEN